MSCWFWFCWNWQQQSPSMCVVVVKFSLQSSTYVLQWLWWMFCIQVVTGYVFKGYVQGAGGLNHYPLCALGLEAFLYRDKLNWNETCCHKFVAAWIRIVVKAWMRFMGMLCILWDFWKEMEDRVVSPVICLLWVKCWMKEWSTFTTGHGDQTKWAQHIQCRESLLLTRHAFLSPTSDRKSGIYQWASTELHYRKVASFSWWQFPTSQSTVNSLFLFPPLVVAAVTLLTYRVRINWIWI